MLTAEQIKTLTPEQALKKLKDNADAFVYASLPPNSINQGDKALDSNSVAEQTLQQIITELSAIKQRAEEKKHILKETINNLEEKLSKHRMEQDEIDYTKDVISGLKFEIKGIDYILKGEKK